MPSSTARWAVRWLVLWMCVAGSALLFAQSTGGRIIGRVADPTGAVLGGVKVTVTNEATSVSRTAQTNENGDYVLVEVQPGSYRVEFEQSGFKKNIQKNVIVEINQVVTLNSTLQLGEAKEVIEVTSEAPLVETTSTQMGAVVNQRAVSQLPLNARDTYQLLQLQPGVQSQTGSDLFYGSNNAGVVSVNGGRGRSNNFSVNGGDANDQFANLPAVQPTPDSIEEFRVLTNTFDAEYGRNSGAVVNVVTKSGTNAFHGNVYEFFRNKVLNSRGFFDSEKPDFKQNQFGGTLGGPIKKDSTFFFTSYEGRRIRQGISSDAISVPSDLERTGDFSASGGAFAGSVSDQTVADVLNARGCNGGNVQVGDSYASLFPGNVIPAECMDPTAVDLMNQFVPPANLSDGASFQTVAGIHKDRTDQFTLKLDHRINDAQNFSAYYYFNDSNLFDPYARFQAGGATSLGFGAGTLERYQQLNFTHNWTLSNNLVNDAHFTYFRESQGSFLHPQRTHLVQDSCTSAVGPDACFNDGTPGNPLGIHPVLGASREGVPFVDVSGLFSYGNNFEGEIPQTGNTFQWSDNLSWVKGTHTFKFGGDVRRQLFDQTLYYNINGFYSYYGGGPNDPDYEVDDGQGGTFEGTLLPSYLLGLPDNFSQGSAQVEKVRSTIFSVFAQDSWKIRKNITLNYGLRWELFTPLTDISQHIQSFRPGQTSAIYPCQFTDPTMITIFQNAGVANPDCDNTGVVPTGLVVPGDQGVPAGLTTTYYKTFAPRIGIAWSPGDSGKTSIRAGWGMFYNPMEQLVLEQFSAEPPFGGSNIIANPLFNTPYLQQDGTQKPNPFNGILDPPRGQAVDWALYRPILLYGQFQPHLRTQYSVQYNFNIQRELTRDLVLQVGYVGSQGHRLLASHDINFGNPNTCVDMQAIADYYTDVAPNQALADAYTCGQFYADSFFDLPADSIPANYSVRLPYGSVASVGPGNPAIRLVGLRKYSSPQCEPTTGVGCPQDGTPVFSSIFAEDTIANSNYNSLQVSLEKRFSHGLQSQFAYTWSKSFDLASSFEGELNPLDFSRTYSLSQFDARHRVVLSYVWQLPIPKYSGVGGAIASGWDISGIYTYQTGFPVRITSSDDNELMYSAFFEYPGEPDQVAPFKSGKTVSASGVHYFNPDAFSQDNTFGRIGNARRTYCCGPPINNFDFALHKNFNLTENRRFEFRAEIFNLFNHTQFDNPDGNITDGTPDFGRIMRAKAPRQVQFALKFFF